MPFNELRRDYLLDRWVVIAAARRRRPTDFVREREVKEISRCPFCPGNERMTPPAVLVYLPSGDGVIKEADSDGFRHKDWIVRCVPNLYPAFTPPKHDESWRGEDSKSDYPVRKAVGHHEVVIESPNHDEHPGSARVSQLVHVINAYLDRYRSLSSHPYVKYVSIFRNHGADAGASLSHAHTQIITTPFIPKIVSLELRSSRRFWSREDACILCDVVSREREGPRLIWENRSFVAFAPWASVHPFELWIVPKRHQSTISEMRTDETHDLAEALRVCLGGLRSLLNDPSYNLGFHMARRGYYHWHIEVYPRLSIWAGFEKSTGTYINVMPPEDAAASLRETSQKESESLQP